MDGTSRPDHRSGNRRVAWTASVRDRKGFAPHGSERIDSSGQIPSGRVRLYCWRATRTSYRVVRTAPAGAYSPTDRRDIAQADRSRHGIAVHELAVALA